MRGRVLLLLGLLAVLPLGAPAVAGPAYVPFVAPVRSGPSATRSTVPSLELYNLGGQPRRYAVNFVAAGEDGSRSGEPVNSGSLAPAGAVTVSCCAGESGLLIVTGAPQIAVGARTVETFLGEPVPNEVLGRLPVLTVKDALPAGSKAVLQTLVGAFIVARTSSLGILNFGEREAHCSVTRMGELANRFADLESILVPPHSLAAMEDVLERLRGPLGPHLYTAQPIVICDQPFYPFAINYAGNPTGLPGINSGLPWVEFVPPSVRLADAP